MFCRELDNEGALGMDCEWTENGGQRQPVALLQLASSSGTCVLVRLAAFSAPLPPSLQVIQKVDAIFFFTTTFFPCAAQKKQLPTSCSLYYGDERLEVLISSFIIGRVEGQS